jgi:hypothetical protein
MIQVVVWAPDLDWTDAETSSPPGFDPLTAQPVASPNLLTTHKTNTSAQIFNFRLFYMHTNLDFKYRNVT